MRAHPWWSTASLKMSRLIMIMKMKLKVKGKVRVKLKLKVRLRRLMLRLFRSRMMKPPRNLRICSELKLQRCWMPCTKAMMKYRANTKAKAILARIIKDYRNFHFHSSLRRKGVRHAPSINRS